jgi:AAA domain-containing protein
MKEHPDANDTLRSEGVEGIRARHDQAPKFKGNDGGAQPPPQPVLSAVELMSMTFQPIKYVVPGVIVEGLTLLAGKPKLGKSWLLLHAAIAVARGGGGFTLGDIHCIEGDVLYCALEDNPRRLQSRMAKLLGATQPPPERLHFRCEMPRLTEGGLDAIKAWITSVKHPRLIIVDTLAMVRMPKKKEQTQYDADYDAVLELRRLANEHNLAVVVVHHLRKMEAEDPFDTISGTLGLSGAPDTTLVLKHDSGGSGAIVLHGRGRDLVEIEKALTFNRNTCVWTIAGELPDVRSSGARRAVLSAMQEIDAPASAREIAAYTRLKTANVQRMLQRMVKDGAVKRLQRGKYQLLAEVGAEELRWEAAKPG